MLGGVVTGVHVNELFILRDTTLTAVSVFYLFLFVRLVINSLVPSILISVQNRYVPIIYQSWALFCEPGSPSDDHRP
jgi:hypothetical protein